MIFIIVSIFWNSATIFAIHKHSLFWRIFTEMDEYFLNQQTDFEAMNYFLNLVKKIKLVIFLEYCEHLKQSWKILNLLTFYSNSCFSSICKLFSIIKNFFWISKHFFKNSQIFWIDERFMVSRTIFMIKNIFEFMNI